jgi:RNA polymerase subunit RPABC4/transcription elongation factor Spt4
MEIGEAEEAKGQCPTCNAIISLDAGECPNCGEIFAADSSDAIPEVVETEPETVSTTRRMDKILFYTSIVLIFLGGPGLAFGSWLHDILRIPLIGVTYDEFGWLNKMFASVGLIVLIIGIILLIISLRRTTVVVEEYDLSFEGKEEGEGTSGETVRE